MSSTNSELLNALRISFPQLFTSHQEDGRQVELLDLEKIRLLAGDGNYSEKFGLRWENKPEQFEADTIGKLPILQRIASKAIHADPYRPTHVLIEGDNYHALKVLAYTHERAVDIIYVDVPYNTGKGDFKYNDRFVDKEDGYRHSKWLSFIAKRVKLSKKLLKDDGVFFISIDDNEQAALTLLCDEVFGEENRIGPFVKKIAGGKNDSKFIKVAHEYLLCYSVRPITSDSLLGRAWARETIQSQTLRKWGDNDKREDRPNLFYPLYVCEATGRVETTAFGDSTEVFPMRSDGTDGCWRWAKSSAERDKDRLQIKRKKSGELDVHVIETAGTKKVSPWPSVIEENTGPGGTALKEILGDATAFSYPKNPDYIRWILSLHPNKDAVVLDFFAGSGTTAQSVMQLNLEDDGSRQCILVTNDEGAYDSEVGNPAEGGICTNVTYPRLKNVIKGYTTPKGKEVAGLGENLEFFKTAFQPLPQSRNQTRSFFRFSTEMLCLKSGCFTAVEAEKRWALFEGTGKNLFVLFDEYANDSALERLRQLSGPVDAYVFAYEADDDTAEMLRTLPNVTVQEVPQPLLDLYFRIKE